MIFVPLLRLFLKFRQLFLGRKHYEADFRLHADIMTTAIASPTQIMSRGDVKLQRKSITWSSLAVGAAMNIFQVSTLGQPLENVKTYVSYSDNIQRQRQFL